MRGSEFELLLRGLPIGTGAAILPAVGMKSTD
jgi:hypothetical protein